MRYLDTIYAILPSKASFASGRAEETILFHKNIFTK